MLSQSSQNIPSQRDKVDRVEYEYIWSTNFTNVLHHGVIRIRTPFSLIEHFTLANINPPKPPYTTLTIHNTPWQQFTQATRPINEQAYHQNDQITKQTCTNQREIVVVKGKTTSVEHCERTSLGTSVLGFTA
jgi:hypothetical protein